MRMRLLVDLRFTVFPRGVSKENSTKPSTVSDTYGLVVRRCCSTDVSDIE